MPRPRRFAMVVSVGRRTKDEGRRELVGCCWVRGFHRPTFVFGLSSFVIGQGRRELVDCCWVRGFHRPTFVFRLWSFVIGQCESFECIASICSDSWWPTSFAAAWIVSTSVASSTILRTGLVWPL